MARPSEIVIWGSEIFLIEQDVKNTIISLLTKEDLNSCEIQALESQVGILKKLSVKKTGRMIV